MPKRNLRFVRPSFPAVGICEYCNTTFTSRKDDTAVAAAEVQAEFDAHKCKPLDSSQNALRIVRESTEGK